jgi:hypothetical protein
VTSYRVIQGCPCNPTVAPYIALLVKDCGATVNSIYRGEDARAILHRHGKSTQAELYRTLPAGVANPPGRSSHELRSDGRAFRGPVGRRLAWWEQGIDVNDADVPRMKRAARARGWELVQHYPSGAEFHHLNFARRPRAKGPRTLAKLIALRRSLPRK